MNRFWGALAFFWQVGSLEPAMFGNPFSHEIKSATVKIATTVAIVEIDLDKKSYKMFDV